MGRPLVIACGVALWVGATPSLAQTSTLEPFAFEARISVGTLAGRRQLSGADVRLSAAGGVTALPSFEADNTATLDLLDGRLTALLQRDVDGELLGYTVSGQWGDRPRFTFQNGSRWVESVFPGFDAPAQGGLGRQWLLDRLCSVAVSVTSGHPEQEVHQLYLRASSSTDDWASGFEGTAREAGPLQQAEGFVRVVVDGLPVAMAEVLLPPGRTLNLAVDAVYPGAHAAKKEVTVRADPQRCASDPTPQQLPLIVLPPPPQGRVQTAYRLRPDPAAPVAQQPSVLRFSSYFETKLPDRSVLLMSEPDEADGVARGTTTLVAAGYTVDLSAVVGWPDGLHGSLIPGRNVSRANFSPLVPLPLQAGGQKGFYPDLSIVLGESEVESLAVDDVFAVGGGGLTLSGCLTASDVAGGEASWQDTAPMPAPVVNELGRSTAVLPYPGRAFGPFVPGSDSYRLAALAGSWQEMDYRLVFSRPPTFPGDVGVEASLNWELASSLSRVETFALGAPFEVPARALPVGAVTVTLRVLDPATGKPRAFRSPEVSIDQTNETQGKLAVRAYGDAELREVHRVVVPSLPGEFDLLVNALVPADPAIPGAELLTSLPTLSAVPFRPPGPDGSCAAICNDPGVNVYWDDDLAPPTLTLANVPSRVYEPFVDLSGVAADESPIVRVQAGDVVATLDGDDSSPRRGFSLRVPVDDSTREITLVARDRCGGERVLTLPVRLWTNTPPVLEPLTLRAREGERVEASMPVIDPDATDDDSPQPLSYSLALDEALPGVSRPQLDQASGLFSWTPGFDQSGRWTFQVTVSDGFATSEARVVVEVEEVNRPPFIERVGAVPVIELLAFPVREGERLELLVEGFDPDDDALSFRASVFDGELPEGLSMSAAGTLTWTPLFEQQGDYVVEVIASDGRGGEDRQAVFLRVGDVNRAPVLEGPAFRAVAEGEALELVYLASDADGHLLSWALEPASLLSRGVSLEPSQNDTAHLRWTPGFDDAGDYVLTVTVTDEQGAQAQAPLVLQVTNTNRPPVFGALDTPVAHGWPGGFDVEVSDPDGQAVTCDATHLPEGVRWDPARRRVSWDDLLWPQGALRVTLVCTDGEDEATLDVDVDSRHFDLVGGCDCSGAYPGTGSLWLFVAWVLGRRRRARSSSDA